MLPFWEVLETQEEKNQILLLYNSFREILFSVAMSMLLDEKRAEDIVHDTFILLMDNLNKIDEAAYGFLEKYLEKKKKRKSLSLKEYSNQTDNYIYVKALSYSITILKNKIYDLTTKSIKDNIVFVEEYFDDIVGCNQTSPEYLLIQGEVSNALKCAIKNLKYPYKEALYLRYYNNFSIEDIGEAINKNPDNVRKILSRARHMLKEQLAKEGYCA